MNQYLIAKYCRSLFAFFIMVFITGTMQAQNKKARVLFIGNSYTYTNDLPKLVADIAASTGDTLVYDISAEGGASFNSHYMSIPATRTKIQSGGWDYIVLQEQSLAPARSPAFFDAWVYPYAQYLVQLARLYNPCVEIIFYMTWGRKNGEPSLCPAPIGWPYLCTYRMMDSVLRERYMLMADSNLATVSPVGPVWRYIMGHHPGIELYDADGSHPSPAGSYAGACSFYTAIFRKPASSTSYDFSLPAAQAATIRTAASRVVYDSMSSWRIGLYETIANFKHTANGTTVNFTNTSANATQYSWAFGDGQTSTVTNPVHTYNSLGLHTVRLISSGASCNDTTYARIVISDVPFIVTPNPATDMLYIRSDLFAQGNCRLQVVNMMGQMVYDHRASGAETQTINVSGLASGIYTLSIFVDKRTYHKKIVIQ